MTPVVAQEFSLPELVEYAVSATGKDLVRVKEILKRGTLVAGASRLRWESIDTADDSLIPILGQLPDPDPSRPFSSAHCLRATLYGPSVRIEVYKEIAEQRRILRRSDFWHSLLAEASSPQYVTYHYREHTDQYRVELTNEAATRVREAAGLLRFDALARQLQSAAFRGVDFYCTR